MIQQQIVKQDRLSGKDTIRYSFRPDRTIQGF